MHITRHDESQTQSTDVFTHIQSNAKLHENCIFFVFIIFLLCISILYKNYSCSKTFGLIAKLPSIYLVSAKMTQLLLSSSRCPASGRESWTRKGLGLAPPVVFHSSGIARSRKDVGSMARPCLCTIVHRAVNVISQITSMSILTNFPCQNQIL